MHLEIFVPAVAKERRAARPEVGEPGDLLRGCQSGRLAQMDSGHGRPLSLPETYGILSLSFDCSDRYCLHWLLQLGGHELLSAVDIVGCAREGGVRHDVYGERGHVDRPDYAPNGTRAAKPVATVFELIAQQFR